MTAEHGSIPPEFQIRPKPEFIAKLENRWSLNNFVCVGLDTDHSQISDEVKGKLGQPPRRIDLQLFAFNAEIIDSTSDLVCSYKSNIAFYEEFGSEGLRALFLTTSYIREAYPDIPVILDAKWADIGNTNNGYVKAAFDKLDVDAITVNPYPGGEGLEPFFQQKDKGILVWVKSSNPGGGELQDLPIDLRSLGSEHKRKFGDLAELAEIVGSNIVPFYQIVAYRAARYWNKNGNVGVVVGATYPEELAQVRKIVGDMPILIPGIGAQGGEVEATVKAGQDSRGQGMIVNSSRGIIFASKDEDFAQVARAKTKISNEEINRYRVHG